MLDLLDLIDSNANELARRLGEVPDAWMLVQRLRCLLAGKQASPWFPRVGFEIFLRAITVIEESMLSKMGWEAEPDPVVRANARAHLRAGLSKLMRLYAAGVDREMMTLKARQKSLKDQVARADALVEGLHGISFTGIAVLAEDGRVVSWSQTAENKTSLAKDLVLGNLVADFLPEIGAAMALLRPENLDPCRPVLTRVQGHLLIRAAGTEPLERSFSLSLNPPCPGPRDAVFVLSIL